MLDFLAKPLFGLALWIDGIVYSLVSYSYRLFLIMSQLNLNIIGSLLSPLVSRVKTLIMVFVLFILAINLIKFLLKPEDMEKGGKALAKNIMIALALLVSYSFIFDLGNDLSMLLIGTTDTSAYKVLEPPDDTSGLVSRLIYGEGDAINKIENFGDYLAASSINIFIHDKGSSTTATDLYNSILSDSSKDFTEIKSLNTSVNKTVLYQYPLLSTIFGIYLIYTIVQIAIEIGIRMFKLMILQAIAPIPICTIIKDGTKGETFKKYYSLYLSILFQAAIRIGSMYISTVLIGKLYNLIMGGSLLPSNLIGTDESGITKLLVLAILIVAAVRFAKDFPKFLKEALPKMDVEGNVGGFGKAMKSIGAGSAAVLGGAAGLVGGAIGGASVGGFLGGVSGAFNGLSSGAKGEGIKGMLQNVEAQRQKQEARDVQGGWKNALKNDLGRQLGITDRKEITEREAIKAENDAIEQANKDIKSKQDEINKHNKEIQSARDTLANSGSKSYGTFGNHVGVKSADDLYNRVRGADAIIAKNSAILKNADKYSNADVQMARNAIIDRDNALREDTEIWYNNTLNSETGVDITSVNSTINRLENDIDDLNSNIDTHNTNIKTHQENIKKLGGKV